MTKGISINIGLNRVDPANYGSQFHDLRGCENDARSMQAIALSQGFDTELILSEDATRDRIINAIEGAAQSLSSGDIFLLTFSGHGSQDLDMSHEEIDGLDEMLVLFDHEMFDDELYSLWGKFSEGVRILFISDSCHSGTQAMLTAEESADDVDEGFFGRISTVPDEDGGPRLVRTISVVAQEQQLGRFKSFYDSIRENLIPRSQVEVSASVIQLAACQDNEDAADGLRNGLFTGHLRRVWADGAFTGDYHQFFSEIVSDMQNTNQQPNLLLVGKPNSEFESQRPFSI